MLRDKLNSFGKNIKCLTTILAITLGMDSSVMGMEYFSSLSSLAANTFGYAAPVVISALSEDVKETSEMKFNKLVAEQNKEHINAFIQGEIKALQNKKTSEGQCYDQLIPIDTKIDYWTNKMNKALICIYWWDKFDLALQEVSEKIKNNIADKKQSVNLSFFQNLQENIESMDINLGNQVYQAYNVKGTGQIWNRVIDSGVRKLNRWYNGDKVIKSPPQPDLDMTYLQIGISNECFGMKKYCIAIKESYDNAFSYTTMPSDFFVRHHLPNETSNLPSSVERINSGSFPLIFNQEEDNFDEKRQKSRRFLTTGHINTPPNSGQMSISPLVRQNNASKLVNTPSRSFERKNLTESKSIPIPKRRTTQDEEDEYHDFGAHQNNSFGNSPQHSTSASNKINSPTIRTNSFTTDLLYEDYEGEQYTNNSTEASHDYQGKK